jgi:hypothetical protein
MAVITIASVGLTARSRPHLACGRAQEGRKQTRGVGPDSPDFRDQRTQRRKPPIKYGSPDKSLHDRAPAPGPPHPSPRQQAPHAARRSEASCSQPGSNLYGHSGQGGAMTDGRFENGSRRPMRLKEAMRQARIELAARSGGVVDLPMPRSRASKCSTRSSTRSSRIFPRRSNSLTPALPRVIRPGSGLT